MPLDYDRLKHWPIPDVQQDYAAKDCILYALGLGFGADPLDPDQLRYVYERDLVAFPTLAVVLAPGASWTRDPGTGINFTQLLHAEQSVELHRPLPVNGSVLAKNRVVEIIDKGAGRGAIAISERQLFIDGEDTPTVTLRSSSFCRADGGFGGPVTASPPAHAMPDRDPDKIVSIATLPQQALIYRLSGDYNELHSDPDIAAQAGFPVPILHGLCSFGTAVRSVVQGLSLDPATVTGAGTRFTAPVYPGETLETSIWRDGDMASFCVRIVERDKLALNHGWVRIGDEA